MKHPKLLYKRKQIVRLKKVKIKGFDFGSARLPAREGQGYVCVS